MLITCAPPITSIAQSSYIGIETTGDLPLFVVYREVQDQNCQQHVSVQQLQPLPDGLFKFIIAVYYYSDRMPML